MAGGFMADAAPEVVLGRVTRNTGTLVSWPDALAVAAEDVDEEELEAEDLQDELEEELEDELEAEEPAIRLVSDEADTG